jgi:hypothetical protein
MDSGADGEAPAGAPPGRALPGYAAARCRPGGPGPQPGSGRLSATMARGLPSCYAGGGPSDLRVRVLASWSRVAARGPDPGRAPGRARGPAHTGRMPVIGPPPPLTSPPLSTRRRPGWPGAAAWHCSTPGPATESHESELERPGPGWANLLPASAAAEPRTSAGRGGQVSGEKSTRSLTRTVAPC